MEKSNLKYFLAANSCEGFVSRFGDCYNPNDGWRVYIIKGGPGTGKSSFMIKIVAKATLNDIKTVICPCSSDPDSLDAVILPQLKIVILDGTSPHTLDPVYPAVCEEILNFGEFWDKAKIDNANDVINITDKNKALHKTASRYLKAAGQLLFDNYKTASACTNKTKVAHFASSLCKKYIPKNDGTAYEWVRFIGGITPKGTVCYTDTITEECKSIIVIDDEYYASSNIIMEKIREYSLRNGYEIITLKNPFLPSLITDHIIIPELSLAFVTENSYASFDCDSRRIHARRFTSNTALHNSFKRLKFNKKVFKNILSSASDTLKQAKTVHDQLESYYIGAMNFEKLNEFADMFCKNLF